MIKQLVSIIIPTYNRADLIGETLDSVLAQTYTNWECIIVDDGSTDDTFEVIQKYVNADSRFKYFERPYDRSKGGNACRNYGFEHSTGEFVKWFDSDDIMIACFISNQVEILTKNYELDFCACFCDVFSDVEINDGKDVNPAITEASKNIFFDFLYENIFFLTPSPLWRKKFLIGKNLFDEELFRGQEADFNFRRLLEHPLFTYSKDKLFLVRRGHKSISSSGRDDIRSFESRFIYYQKMFQNMEFFSDNKLMKQSARRYIIYRLSTLFANLYLSDRKNIFYKQLNSNIRQTEIQLFTRLKLLAGIKLLNDFGVGYRLVANLKK